MDKVIDPKVRPITTDFRTGENEDLFCYIAKYAKEFTGGKLAPAIISIVRDHEQSKIDRSMVIISGDKIISR